MSMKTIRQRNTNRFPALQSCSFHDYFNLVNLNIINYHIPSTDAFQEEALSCHMLLAENFQQMKHPATSTNHLKMTDI